MGMEESAPTSSSTVCQDDLFAQGGDGSQKARISIWHDHWHPSSPLSDIVSSRDIHRAGFNLGTTIKESICNGQWLWPAEWYLKYPPLASITVPPILERRDSIEWRVLGNLKHFSVATIWESIRRIVNRGTDIVVRKSKTQDTLRHWDVSNNANLHMVLCMPRVSSSLDDIVDVIIALPKKRSVRGIITRLVFAASTYFIWQERNSRLFKSQRSHSLYYLWKLMAARVPVLMDVSSLLRVVYGSHLEYQLGDVLFFPSPRFFPMGFSWEGFLRRQDLLGSMALGAKGLHCVGGLCSFRWFLSYWFL
ncbi:hypothetical protein Tco_0385620 [Tanacetum coccineum]